MRQGFAASLLVPAVVLGCALSFQAQAADPSLHEIYRAAESGHLDQAQSMIGTVLADHPNSAKAHFVAAELDARQGRIAGAQEQLATAERLAPGLPFAKPEAVSALRAQLSGVRSQASSFAPAATPSRGIPWTPIVLGAMLIGLFLMWRNTRRPVSYVASLPPAASAGPYGAPYPGTPPPSGGPGSSLGSTLGTGLAGGLAAGAGIVAGEALMNRLLNGGEREREVIVREDRSGLANSDDRRGNSDLGGQDFGVNDGGSWDDDAAASGGGDDWG